VIVPDGTAAWLRSERAAARARRRGLGPGEQTAAAGAALAAVTASQWWDTARTVAGYVATDGELDPAPILVAARDAGKQVALPVVHGDVLVFRLDVGPRRPGPWGGEEPPPGAPAVAVAALDLVLVPLTLADRRGGRAGRGGGFYDRAFAFRREGPGPPWLVGLAHVVQLIDEVPVRDHDVRLDALAVGDRRRLLVPGVAPGDADAG
jgi:5-formyltetrahydrofolate cyclo-ligase